MQHSLFLCMVGQLLCSALYFHAWGYPLLQHSLFSCVGVLSYASIIIFVSGCYFLVQRSLFLCVGVSHKFFCRQKKAMLVSYSLFNF